MKSWYIPRRTFLKGMGTSILLPALDVMFVNDAMAAAAMKPRFAAVFMPMSIYGGGCDMSKNNTSRYFAGGLPTDNNGQGAWKPVSAGALPATLPVILDKLSSLRDKFSIVSGLTTMPNETGSSHSLGVSSWLTAGWDSFEQAATRAKSPPTSVDQALANALGYTAGSSIAFNPSLGGTQAGGSEAQGGYMAAVSYNSRLGGNNIVPKATDPKVIFDKLFKNCKDTSQPSDPAADAETKMQTNVLDKVLDSIKSVKSKLGKEDTVRMDSYLQSISDLQTSLSSVSEPTGGKCPTYSANGQDWVNKLNAMVDVIAFALYTEAMPVASLMLDSEVPKVYFADTIATYGDYIGLSGKKILWPSKTTNIHNDVVHKAGMTEGGVTSIEQYIAYNRMNMLFVKRLMEKLDAKQDLNGLTALENSLVITGTAHSNGNGHNCGNLPTLLAGGKRYGFKMGQHIAQPARTDIGHFHYTLLRAMLGESAITDFNGHSKNLTSLFG